MENLEKIFIVERKDIEIKDKKILHKYTKIKNRHKAFDIRFNNINSDLIIVNNESIQKIFNFLIEEVPEEHILFLFEKELNEKKIEPKNEFIISTNTNNKKNEEENEENEEKKQFLTLEIENPENPVLKKFRTVTHQIMKKYYFIFFILCFIIAILFSIHFFSYLISKELSFNFIDFFRINYWKYIFGCGGLITLYTLLGYYYFTKFKADKPSYSTIKKLQIFCLVLTLLDYLLIKIEFFAIEELVEFYKNHNFYINLIYFLSFLCSSGILGFYFMVKKRRGNFSQYDEVLIQ